MMSESLLTLPKLIWAFCLKCVVGIVLNINVCCSVLNAVHVHVCLRTNLLLVPMVSNIWNVYAGCFISVSLPCMLRNVWQPNIICLLFVYHTMTIYSIHLNGLIANVRISVSAPRTYLFSSLTISDTYYEDQIQFLTWHGNITGG